MPQLVATLIYLSQIYSYYIRGDRSPLKYTNVSSQFALEHALLWRASLSDQSSRGRPQTAGV